MNQITKIPTIAYDLPAVNGLTDVQRERCLKAAEHLKNAFGWQDSVEGDKFWLAIYRRLEGLGNNTEPLK
jgi:hypothetical protein